MTELEKAARMALEALDSLLDVAMVPMTCEGLCSAESVDKWHDFSFRRDALRSALTQALSPAEPVKPLFATKVAAQKWAELQEQGHRMQTIWFDGGPGGAGTIDPWGKVTWSKTEPAPTERKGEPSGVRTVKVRARLTDDFSDCLFDDVTTEHKGEPVALQHMAVAEDGVLRWMTGRKIDNCELYAMPDFGRAPTLYTSPQVPEDVQMDAERYRKIRQGSAWPCAFASHDAPEPLTGDDLDAAIDAARKGE